MIFNGYKFRGKHATYAKFLATDKGSERKDGLNIFNRILDVYMISAIVGLIYDRRSQIDNSVKDSSDIEAQQMYKEQEKLMYIYRLILLLDTSTGLTEQERINRAFKTDDDENQIKKNLELFNSYVLGGVEHLYDVFSNSYGNEDDIMNEMLSFVETFNNYGERYDI